MVMLVEEEVDVRGQVQQPLPLLHALLPLLYVTCASRSRTLKDLLAAVLRCVVCARVCACARE